jgi:hypothetical protein
MGIPSSRRVTRVVTTTSLAALLVRAASAQQAPPRPPPASGEPAPYVGEPYIEPERAPFGGAFTLGLLYTGVVTSKRAHAIGAEATYVTYWWGRSGPGIGAFGQAQTYDFDHGRYAAGGQINLSALGMEVGYAYRGATEGYSPTRGLQIGPFLSFGLLVLAVRVVVPMTEVPAGRPPAQDTEVGISVAFKYPFIDIPRGDETVAPNIGMAHGRPLDIGKGQVLASVRRTPRESWAG